MSKNLQKTLRLLVIGILLVMFAFALRGHAEWIVVYGEVTEEQREQNLQAYHQRIVDKRLLINGQLERKHKLRVESVKFLNAVMLERAGTNKIYINARSYGSTLTNTSENTNEIGNITSSSR